MDNHVWLYVYLDVGADCLAGQFVCDNGRCLDRTQQCNRVNDCGDNSDELNCGVYKVKEIQFK